LSGIIESWMEEGGKIETVCDEEILTKIQDWIKKYRTIEVGIENGLSDFLIQKRLFENVLKKGNAI
jgi:hypothetical protein